MKLIDLSDERRKNKPWLPEDDRDVTNGLVYQDSWGKPACKLHGAMNRVSSDGYVYRCSDPRCGLGGQLVASALPGHRCGDRCICPIHETPLIYAPGKDDHACQDVDCVHGHGGFDPINHLWDQLRPHRRPQ